MGKTEFAPDYRADYRALSVDKAVAAVERRWLGYRLLCYRSRQSW